MTLTIESSETRVIVDLICALESLLHVGQRECSPNALENAEMAAAEALSQARKFLHQKHAPLAVMIVPALPEETL